MGSRAGSGHIKKSVYPRLFLTTKNLANSKIHVKSVATVDARGYVIPNVLCFCRKALDAYYIYKRRLYTLPFYMDRQCESL